MLKNFFLALALLLWGGVTFGQTSTENNTTSTDSVTWSVKLLNRLLFSNGEWYLSNRASRVPIRSLVNHAQDMPVDTTIVKITEILKDENYMFLFDRRPDDIKDLSKVPGYITPETIEKMSEELALHIKDSLEQTSIDVPDHILQDVSNLSKEISVVASPELYNYDNTEIPDNFRNRLIKEFSKVILQDSLTIFQIDSAKTRFADSILYVYNEEQRVIAIDSISNDYRAKFIEDQATQSSTEFTRKKERMNREKIYTYNDEMVEKTQDSTLYALEILRQHAMQDSLLMGIINKDGLERNIWTNNLNDKQFTRHYLKNLQNDSLSVVLYNTGKGKTTIIIDDAVSFQRFSQAQKKEVTLDKIKSKNEDAFVQIKRKTPKASPWDLNGYVNFGLTQTALTNWAAGGESSVSILGIGNYNINYKTTDHVWENSFDVKYGTQKTQDESWLKNSDKFEFNSRYGTTAFKHWYYSVETNFKTQFSIGWSNSNKTTKVSQFMAPGYWTTAIGMTYSPDKKLSVFISPLTAKATFVSKGATEAPRDSVDETRYGLKEGQNSFWEPGFILKSTYKRNIMENIAMETKAEIFSNYNNFFRAIDVSLEGKLIMQVNQYINAQLVCNMVYDDDVKFDTGELDSEGNKITENRVQFKESFTAGFTYRFY